MSAALERYLARLYTDAALRARFLADPRGTLADAPLDDDARRQLLALDRMGLSLQARSLAAKRGSTAPRPRFGDRMRAWWTTLVTGPREP